MDDINLYSNPVQPESPPSEAPVPTPKTNNKAVLIIFSLLLIAMVGGIAYLGFQNYVLQKEVDSLKTTPSPTPIQETPPADPTANWITYTNSVDNFSFKYPETWTIDTTGDKGDARQENIQVKLTKDQAKVQIYANMVGIGGAGQNFEGTPVKVGGYDFYKYEIDNTYNHTVQIGITDTLKESLGLFQVFGKTYSVSLTYPNTYTAPQISGLGQEFELILSTFKFTK